MPHFRRRVSAYDIPMPPLELPDLREMNKLLLKCGAEIAEINTIRKHLDGLKGGRLSKKIFPRRGFGLILSDVIGDPLEIIASGPTVPDPSTYSDVDRIMKKYEIHDKIPKNIASILNDGLSGKIPETPKDTDPCFKSMTNILIGSALLAEQTYEGYFEAKEIPSKKIETMEGEALDFGKKLANRLYSQDMTKNITKQICYISSGEFTVTLTGNGVGGRNQEMLLGFLIEECKTMIENPEKYNEFGENFRYTFTSCAFDGLEGNSEAMGAIIDSATLGRICDLLNAKNDDQILKYLEDTAKNNNSYELFSKLNDALVVGYTGTNVNDSLLLLISQKIKIFQQTFYFLTERVICGCKIWISWCGVQCEKYSERDKNAGLVQSFNGLFGCRIGRISEGNRYTRS